MDQTYPRNEKLKSRKSIEALFTGGKSISEYPIRLAYRTDVFEDAVLIKMGVSVSKKNFKRAVDRNYLKRVLRECYRRNKSILLEEGQPYAMMLLYQSKEMLPFAEIERLVKSAFERFAMKQRAQPGN